MELRLLQYFLAVAREQSISGAAEFLHLSQPTLSRQLKDLEEEGHDFESLYGGIPEKNHTYEIGYLIGEEEYLNRGIGKMIIWKLEEKIIELGGREVAADPSEENAASIKVLLSNGFKKKSDGDYRKIVHTQ